MGVSKSASEDTQSLESSNKKRWGPLGWMTRGGGGSNSSKSASRSNRTKTTTTRTMQATTTLQDGSSGTPKTSNVASLKEYLENNAPAQDKLAALSLTHNNAAATTTTTTMSNTTATAAKTADMKHPAGILKTRSAADADSTTAATALKKEAAATTAAAAARPLQKPSWFCRTAHFRRMCDTAFDIVDANQSGTVDSSELYSGLLLIHLKLGTYAGPAACRPLSRDLCQAVFSKMDLDGSGTLDRTEFRNVMAVLFSNVVLRVLVQWSMTLMIVPWVAQAMLTGILQLVALVVATIETLDEHSDVANSVELTIEDASAWCLAHSPPSLLSVADRVSAILAMVPESVWQAVPLTLLSTILGIVVVPWCIFQVDDFFQRLADRKAKQKKGAERGSWI
jgi:hypothetical protein